MSAHVVWTRGTLRVIGIDRALQTGEAPESLGNFGDGLYLERRTKDETVWVITYDSRDFREALAALLGEHDMARVELDALRAKVARLLVPPTQPAPPPADPFERVHFDAENPF